MINTNYASQVAYARDNNASGVNFNNKQSSITPSTQDTLTLSPQAQAMMQGKPITAIETAPTYVNPVTARSLLAQQQTKIPSSMHANTTNEKADNRFGDMMQKILDQRLGIDREKLDELEAMMEEVAKNENLSPEEKQKALEELKKIREQIIEESLKTRDVAKQANELDELS